MAEPFIGEIREVGFTFAPPGWLPCDGRLLSISGYEALFALIGTTYGGDGSTTFGLPDLQGRAPVHQGQRPGGATYVLGQKSGAEQVTLSAAQMAAHTHLVSANAQMANLATPSTQSTFAQLSPDGATAAFGFSAAPANTHLAASTVSTAGGGQPFAVQQPFLAITYIIATEGLFPSQS